jgi:hypothetical protein
VGEQGCKNNQMINAATVRRFVTDLKKKHTGNRAIYNQLLGFQAAAQASGVLDKSGEKALERKIEMFKQFPVDELPGEKAGREGVNLFQNRHHIT